MENGLPTGINGKLRQEIVFFFHETASFDIIAYFLLFESGFEVDLWV